MRGEGGVERGTGPPWWREARRNEMKCYNSKLSRKKKGGLFGIQVT